MHKRIMIPVFLCIFITSCSSMTVKEAEIPDKTGISERLNIQGTSFENLYLPEEYNIRQFEGMTLNFIVENNLFANILSHESEDFSKITGIKINIKPVDFDTLVQKINLDFIAQAGQYQIIYVDPYQTLNRFSDYLEILNPYDSDPNLPKIDGFLGDFFENQTMVCSYFKNDNNVYAVPFDSTTMILYYRKDVFDKYGELFRQEKGYDWNPGTSGFSWERYCEVAEWINENVPDDEVQYGSGLMAQEHNSIFCEFSNILAAYGGDYFSDDKINTMGLDTFSRINVLDEDFIQALDMYKKIAGVSAPKSVNWNWTELAGAFRNGEVAMMANWDENYTYIEDKLYSKVYGKVGYTILPCGDRRSANIYGGSGIGINRYASEEEKQAAWLYLVWATSKEMQLSVLKHPEGGCLPTRKSAYEDPMIRLLLENPDSEPVQGVVLKHMNAVLEAWEPQNTYLRPKVSSFYEAEKVLISNLHDLIVQNLDSRATAEKINQELEQIAEENR